jgi:lipopolysaccharide/colanic/teichoic acid biosynthesis glycosyltransferase
MAKRLFDLVISTIFLICLTPLLILLAIWIKFDSKGKILYRQVRVGKYNNDFLIYKFRTMRPEADKESLLTVGGRDSRITHAGYFLRKYKLDELPQLLNVVKGDMSLVGPRPEVRKYVKLYTNAQRMVLNVRPGITDYASIQFRNENDLLAAAENPEKTYIEEIMPQKLALNLMYIKEAGLINDLKIIFLTIKKIIFY